MNETGAGGHEEEVPGVGRAWVGPPHGHALRLEFGPETWRSAAYVGGVQLYPTKMSISTDKEDALGLSVVRLEVPFLNDPTGRPVAVYEGVLLSFDEYREYLAWRNDRAREARPGGVG